MAVGVAGEFRIHTIAGKIEIKMRDDTRELVAIVNSEAAGAEERARRADERATANEAEAKRLEGENLELQKTIQPRSLRLDQQRSIGDALGQFKGAFMMSGRSCTIPRDIF